MGFFDAPDALTKWVKPMSFEALQEKYKEFFVLERKNGIVVCRLHTNGGPAKFSIRWHNAQAMFFKDICQDRSNELIIFTGTGDRFIDVNGDFGDLSQFKMSRDGLDHFYLDAVEMIEGFLYNVNIPTIAALNGPGAHFEWPMMADIVICSENAAFNDGHYPSDLVAGDGQALVFMQRMGFSRGNHFVHTGEMIDAQDALKYGLVNEVLPSDRLMDRAWELAEFMMKRPRSVRRMHHETIVRHWKDLFHRHFGHQLALETASACMDFPGFVETIKKNPVADA